VPEQLENRWFIYWHDNTLFFDRSWTGYRTFRFAKQDECYCMVGADGDRAPELYRERSNALDPEKISALIDLLIY